MQGEGEAARAPPSHKGMVKSVSLAAAEAPVDGVSVLPGVPLLHAGNESQMLVM